MVFIEGKSSNFTMMRFLSWNKLTVRLVLYSTLAHARCPRARHKFPSPQYVYLGRIFALLFYDAPGQGIRVWLMPSRNVWIKYNKSQTNLALCVTSIEHFSPRISCVLLKQQHSFSMCSESLLFHLFFFDSLTWPILRNSCTDKRQHGPRPLCMSAKMGLILCVRENENSLVVYGQFPSMLINAACKPGCLG